MPRKSDLDNTRRVAKLGKISEPFNLKSIAEQDIWNIFTWETIWKMIPNPETKQREFIPNIEEDGKDINN